MFFSTFANEIDSASANWGNLSISTPAATKEARRPSAPLWTFRTASSYSLNPLVSMISWMGARADEMADTEVTIPSSDFCPAWRSPDLNEAADWARASRIASWAAAPNTAQTSPEISSPALVASKVPEARPAAETPSLSKPAMIWSAASTNCRALSAASAVRVLRSRASRIGSTNSLSVAVCNAARITRLASRSRAALRDASSLPTS